MGIIFLLFAATLAVPTTGTSSVDRGIHTITGVVTYADSSCMILANNTNHFAAFTPDPKDIANYIPPNVAVATGDVAAVTYEITRLPSQVPTFRTTSIAIIGRNATPPMRDATLDEIVKDNLYLHHVRTRGTIVDLAPDDIDSRFIQSIVRDGSTSVQLPLSRHQAAVNLRPADLLYAEIEAEGFCFDFYPSARFIRTPFFILSNPAALRITKSPAKPFDFPRLKSDSFASPAELIASGPRTLVGTVIACWGGNHILVQDAPRAYANSHRVDLLPDVPLPRIGTRIEAVGRPETDIFRTHISRADYRQLPPDPTPDQRLPEPANQANIINDGHYNAENFGRLLHLRGTVVSTLPSQSRSYLTAGEYGFSVDCSVCPEKLAEFQHGCILEVSGVCLYESENWRPNAQLPRILGMTVIARGPDDIHVISRPPFWSGGRLFILIGALFSVIVAILIWNRILNRLVFRRSRQLLREQYARRASELRIHERTRLAVELHDTLSQNLIGVACQITSAQNAIPSANTLAHQRLNAAEHTLQSCRTELRQVLADLRGSALELPRIDEALRLVLNDIAHGVDLVIRFSVPRVRLSDRTLHASLCIIRELVGNAIRHGAATSIWIAGAIDGATLQFSVRENGRGFNPTSCPGPQQGHFGLDGIRNRVKRLNGKFTLNSTAGKGSYATISLPATQPDTRQG